MAWHHRGLGPPGEGRAQGCEKSLMRYPQLPSLLGRARQLKAQRGEMGRQRPQVPSLWGGKRHSSLRKIFCWLWGIIAVLGETSQAEGASRAWLAVGCIQAATSDRLGCLPLISPSGNGYPSWAIPVLLPVREVYPGLLVPKIQQPEAGSCFQRYSSYCSVPPFLSQAPAAG